MTAAIVRADAQLILDKNFNAGVTDNFASVYVTKPLTDGKILVGGNFRSVNGVEKSGLARLNADGSLDGDFTAGVTGAGGSVYEIIQLSDGKFLIGGSFTNYQDTVKGGIVRINADGSIDNTFNNGGTGLNGAAQTIALQPDGKILISGSSIISYNGVTRYSVVRLNVDGSLDTGFTSPFTTSQFVEEVDVQADGKIIIGGAFYLSVAGKVDVVRLNEDGSVDRTFNTAGIGTDGGGVYAMIIQPDGKILIGGGFRSYNNVSRLGLARLNIDGSLDASFDPNIGIGIDGGEYFALQNDGKILAAGGFGGSSANFSLVRLNSNGSVDNSFNTYFTDANGYHISVQNDGKFLLSGLFTKVDSAVHRYLVRFNADSSIDNSFNPTFSTFSAVNALARQSDGKIIAAGGFNLANGVSRTNISRFNADGTIDTSFDSGSGTFFDPVSSANVINDVAVQTDGKILIGGNFGGYQTGINASIARLNPNGQLDASFYSAFNNYSSSAVYDLFIQPDGKILVGGIFTPDNLSSSQLLLRLNADGSLDTSFSGTPNNLVRSIVRQSDGKYLIGGSFSMYSGVSRSRLVRINADGSPDASFNNTGFGFNGTVYDTVQLANGKILAAGAFTSYNGNTVNRIARLNADGTLDTTFNSGNSGANAIVYSIALQPNGKIIIGGLFSTYNSVATNRLVRLSADGYFDSFYISGIDSSFTSGFDNDPRFYVRRLLNLPDGRLIVGGTFKAYQGVAKNSLLKLTLQPARPGFFDFNADGKSDFAVFRPSNATWYIFYTGIGYTIKPWGSPTDRLVPADYDGDGQIDTVVYRDGYWYISRTSDGQVSELSFGTTGDIPVPADFDGDGKADLTVYRPSNGVWYRLNSSDNKFVANNWGSAEDKPVIGDFDGDGKADLTVYRPSNNVWYRLNSSNGQFSAVSFGSGGDLLVPGDYDGDGKTDIAVFRPSTSIWYRLNSSDGSFSANAWGTTNDKPVPADYDGDGKTDIAVYRNGNWYIIQSSNGQLSSFNFGDAGDIPIAYVYVDASSK